MAQGEITGSAPLSWNGRYVHLRSRNNATRASRLVRLLSVCQRVTHVDFDLDRD